MKIWLSVLIGMVLAGICPAQVTDSSALIFNDTVVNHFRISFYFPEWHDSLVTNKSIDESYIPGRVAWYGPNGDSIILDSVGVRYKGNSSYNIGSEKKPFKLHFCKYRKDQRFFSLEKLNFSNGVLDPTMMREKIAYDILKKYLPSPRAAFATLTVEDTLVDAFYTQVEQVDELFLRRHFENDNDNLYKAGDQGVSLLYKTANQADYEKDFELKTNESENDWSVFIAMIYRLNTTADEDFVKVMGGLLDLDNCIRYLAFNMVNANFDSYTGSGRNFYLYDDRKCDKFRLIPWDVNLSFGAYAYTWANNLASVDAFTPSNLDQRPLEKRILTNDSLRTVYANYMKSMIEGPLSADSVAAMGHRFRDIVDSAVMHDEKKFFTYEQFVANIDTELITQEGIQRKVLPGLKSFTAKRNANLLVQIEKVLPVTQPRNLPEYNRGSLLRCAGRVQGGWANVRYSVQSPEAGVTLAIYNVKGTRLRSYALGSRRCGEYTARLDIQSIPSGYCIIKLKNGETAASRSFLHLKND